MAGDEPERNLHRARGPAALRRDPSAAPRGTGGSRERARRPRALRAVRGRVRRPDQPRPPRRSRARPTAHDDPNCAGARGCGAREARAGPRRWPSGKAERDSARRERPSCRAGEAGRNHRGGPPKAVVRRLEGPRSRYCVDRTAGRERTRMIQWPPRRALLASARREPSSKPLRRKLERARSARKISGGWKYHLTGMDVRVHAPAAATPGAAAADVERASVAVDELLWELVTQIRDTLRVDTAAVLLLDESRENLIPRAAKGLEEEVEAQ